MWVVPGRNAIAGEYRGLDAVIDYFTRRRELADRSFRMHPGEVLVGDGDHVAALTDGTATIDGVEHRWSTVGLYRLRDERVAACWLLPLDPAAFDAIWSPLGSPPALTELRGAYSITEGKRARGGATGGGRPPSGASYPGLS